MDILVIPGPFQKKRRAASLEKISDDLTREIQQYVNDAIFQVYDNTRGLKSIGIVSAIIDKNKDPEDIGYFVFLSHLVKLLNDLPEQYKLIFLTIGYDDQSTSNHDFDQSVPYAKPFAMPLPLYEDPKCNIYNLVPLSVRINGLRHKKIKLQRLEVTDKGKGFSLLQEYVLPFFDIGDLPWFRWSSASDWKLVRFDACQDSPRRGVGPFCSGDLKKRNHVHYCISKELTLEWSQKPTCEVRIPDEFQACFWVHYAEVSSGSETPQTRTRLKIDLRVERK